MVIKIAYVWLQWYDMHGYNNATYLVTTIPYNIIWYNNSSFMVMSIAHVTKTKL